ncbi:hypothetical protein AB1Y20_000771 [Prymnesium parvum]|uniref:PI3K/PI4K catalytic domain-containing protein n=1 Tax=Prymnesium parvum TaxID=97485 RepID=A0AB34KB20_PRYPA
MQAEAEAKAWLATLLVPEESSSRRAHAAASLHALFLAPASAPFARQMVVQLLHVLEPLTRDRAEAVRERALPLLAALGFAVRPDFHAFCAWFVHAASVRPQPADWPPLLSLLDHLLHLLLEEGSARSLTPFLPEMVACVRSLLHSLEEPSLLAPLVSLFVTLSDHDFAPALLPHFAEVIDVLLGWSLDRSSPQLVSKIVNDGLRQFHVLWSSSVDFCSTMLHNLVSDMEASSPETLPVQQGVRAQPPMLHNTLRVGRFAECVSAIIHGFGAAFSSLPQSGALLGRYFTSLQAHALLVAEARGIWSQSVAAPFLPTATACVCEVAEVVQGSFAPHHEAASAIVLSQLHHCAPAETIVNVIESHRRLMLLQGPSLPAHAARALLTDSSADGADPEGGCGALSHCRTHLEPGVVSAVLATQWQLLLGENTSSAAGSVLLQGILTELRGLVGALGAPPSEVAEAITRSIDTSAVDSEASDDEDVAVESPSEGQIVDSHLLASRICESCACWSLRSCFGANPCEGTQTAKGREATDTARERLAEWAREEAKATQLLQLDLAVLAHLMSQTTHCSQLLSTASNLLGRTHPLRHVAVSARPALSYSIVFALLSVVHNTSISLPPPPGTGKPLHASLCTLAAQLRVLISGLLDPSRPPAARLLALHAATAALTAAGPHTPVMVVPADHSDEGVSTESDEGGDSSFAIWLGCELGAREGKNSSLRLGNLLRRALRFAHDPSEEIRAIANLGPMPFGCILHTAIVQLQAPRSRRSEGPAGSESSLLSSTSHAAALRLLTHAAPMVLCALNPHAPVELVWAPSRQAEAAAQDAPHTANADDWRRQLMACDPLPGFGAIQLQLVLNLLSGTRDNKSEAFARLFYMCASSSKASSHRPILRGLPHLANWWAGLEGARFLVASRLRSPYGGPAQTFEGLERMLQAVLAPGDPPSPNAKSRESALLLLHTLEHLERQIQNAFAGSLALPPPPRQARLFFLNNRRVCLDWFSRIRLKLIQAALLARQPASVVRHGQLRLAELTSRINSLCARSSTSGRLDLPEQQLKPVLSLLRDAEWVLFVMTEALSELGSVQALEGLALYTRRKLSLAHAAAYRAQQSSLPTLQLLQSADQLTQQPAFNPPAGRGPWAPWLEGVRLQSAGLLEEASTELQALLHPMEAALAAEPAQASFIATRLSMCYTELADIEALDQWHKLLATYREAYDSAGHHNTAHPASPFAAFVDARTIEALSNLHTPPGSPQMQHSASSARAGPAAAPISIESMVTTWPWLVGARQLSLQRLSGALARSEAQGINPKVEDLRILENISRELELVVALGSKTPMSALPDLVQESHFLNIVHAPSKRATVNGPSACTDVSQLQTAHALDPNRGLAGGAWPAHDTTAALLGAQASHLGAWLTLLRCEERACFTSTTNGSIEAWQGLRLALIKFARRHGNVRLASNLVSGLSGAEPWVSARKQFEEVLVQRASGQVHEALEALWHMARPLLSGHGTATSSSEGLTRCKVLLKLAGWLQDRQYGALSSTLREDLLDWYKCEGSRAMAVPIIQGAVAANDITLDAIAVAQDAVCCACLEGATVQAPNHAKAQLRWGNWCYKQGSSVLKSLSGSHARTELSADEELRLRQLVNERLATAFLFDSPKLSAVWVELGILLRSQERFGSEESNFEVSGDVADSAERELRRRFDELLPGVATTTDGEVILQMFVKLWRDVRQRLLEPLRTAVRALFCYMRLSDEQSAEHASVSVPLRLLRLLLKHGAGLQQEFVDGISCTPSVVWRGIVPQLFARLSHPECVVRQHVQSLLCSIGKDLPELVLYPALAGTEDSRLTASSFGTDPIVASPAVPNVVGRTEMQAICRSLQEHNPQLVEQLQLFIAELARITLLWEDQLSYALQSLQADVGNRVRRLRDESARVAANTRLPATEKARILRQKYSAIMAPVVRALEQQAKDLSSPAATPHEESFQRGALRTFREAIATFRQPIASGFERCWEPFRGLQREMNSFLRRPALSLALISPTLVALRGTQIPMPGLAVDQFSVSAQMPPSDSSFASQPSSPTDHTNADDGGLVCLERFGEEMAVLPTKTKPKKMLLRGSDGREYNYLLKGREDLHLDERIMQFLRVVNNLLREDRHTRLFPALRARHYAVLPLGPRSGLIQWVQNVTPLFTVYKSWQQRNQAAATLREKGAEAEHTNDDFVQRPAELFFAKLRPALKSKGLTPSSPRKDWPHEILRRVTQELIAETPRDLLAQEFWCQSADTNEWWLKTQSFARSSAVMSIVGYVIGLGDRHLDNILLDMRSGELLHIDYNVCFEKGLRLKEDQRKGAELAVALSLAASRVDELQGPLLHWEAQLISTTAQFCKPLDKLFSAHAQLADFQARHSELVRHGASALEHEETLQSELDAALRSLAELDEPFKIAREASTSSKHELRKALERCSVWHLEHVHAIELIRGQYLSQLAGEITNVYSALPADGANPLASRIQAAAGSRGYPADLPQDCIAMVSDHRNAEHAVLQDELGQV